MEGNGSLTKLQRICRLGYRLAFIAAIAMFCLLIGNAVVLSQCSMDPGFAIPTLNHVQTCISSMEEVLFCAFNTFLCVMAYRILKVTSTHYTPFTTENVNAMKAMSAVSVIAFAIILAAQLFMTAVMETDEYLIELPFEFLVIGVITYVFALLIEYGTVLQTESDHFL